MARFRPDNTEGYDTAQLAELNRRFEAALAAKEPIDKDICSTFEDAIAEAVQQEFDTRN